MVVADRTTKKYIKYQRRMPKEALHAAIFVCDAAQHIP